MTENTTQSASMLNNHNIFVSFPPDFHEFARQDLDVFIERITSGDDIDIIIDNLNSTQDMQQTMSKITYDIRNMLLYHTAKKWFQAHDINATPIVVPTRSAKQGNEGESDGAYAAIAFNDKNTSFRDKLKAIWQKANMTIFIGESEEGDEGVDRFRLFTNSIDSMSLLLTMEVIDRLLDTFSDGNLFTESGGVATRARHPTSVLRVLATYWSAINALMMVMPNSRISIVNCCWTELAAKWEDFTIRAEGKAQSFSEDYLLGKVAGGIIHLIQMQRKMAMLLYPDLVAALIASCASTGDCEEVTLFIGESIGSESELETNEFIAVKIYEYIKSVESTLFQLDKNNDVIPISDMSLYANVENTINGFSKILLRLYDTGGDSEKVASQMAKLVFTSASNPIIRAIVHHNYPEIAQEQVKTLENAAFARSVEFLTVARTQMFMALAKIEMGIDWGAYDPLDLYWLYSLGNVLTSIGIPKDVGKEVQMRLEGELISYVNNKLAEEGYTEEVVDLQSAMFLYRQMQLHPIEASIPSLATLKVWDSTAITDSSFIAERLNAKLSVITPFTLYVIMKNMMQSPPGAFLSQMENVIHSGMVALTPEAGERYQAALELLDLRDKYHFANFFNSGTDNKVKPTYDGDSIKHLLGLSYQKRALNSEWLWFANVLGDIFGEHNTPISVLDDEPTTSSFEDIDFLLSEGGLQGATSPKCLVEEDISKVDDMENRLIDKQAQLITIVKRALAVSSSNT